MKVFRVIFSRVVFMILGSADGVFPVRRLSSNAVWPETVSLRAGDAV